MCILLSETPKQYLKNKLLKWLQICMESELLRVYLCHQVLPHQLWLQHLPVGLDAWHTAEKGPHLRRGCFLWEGKTQDWVEYVFRMIVILEYRRLYIHLQTKSFYKLIM